MQMQPMHLKIFQSQLLLQLEYVVWSAEGVNMGLNQHDPRLVFFSIQNLLYAAANAAKALWGGGGAKAKARAHLRDSIGVSDESPLKRVDMRNNFDHYDERIDRWWRDSKRHNHLDLSVGPKGSISGIDDIDMFRQFDPATTNVFFWGQEFNIQELVDEATRLLPKLRIETANPHWESRS